MHNLSSLIMSGDTTLYYSSEMISFNPPPPKIPSPFRLVSKHMAEPAPLTTTMQLCYAMLN